MKSYCWLNFFIYAYILLSFGNVVLIIQTINGIFSKSAGAIAQNLPILTQPWFRWTSNFLRKSVNRALKTDFPHRHPQIFGKKQGWRQGLEKICEEGGVMGIGIILRWFFLFYFWKSPNSRDRAVKKFGD